MREAGSARSSLALLAMLALVAGMLAASAGTASGGGGTAAPVGVWSGDGDHETENDYTAIAIMDGPVGAQPAFWVEYFVAACGGPGVLFGTATYDGSDVAITGDMRCTDTGTKVFDDITLTYEYNDSADELENKEYPGPFVRRCNGANSTHTGDGGDNGIDGTSDHDVIDGKGGNDTLRGKGGIDILCGRNGKDRLIGGGDVDILVGGSKKDRLKGSGGGDLLLGEGGGDIARGGGGRDWMFGDGGGDDLSGGKGKDYADGGNGTDICDAETTVNCP